MQEINNPQHLSFAERIGASAIGVADYRILNEERVHLDTWLGEQCEANLDYMRKHMREDPRIIFPECRTVVVVLYSPQKWSYHNGIRKSLKRLLGLLKEVDPGIEGRGVVDTAPILERAWGVEANLGWVGRNSMLIHPKLGSNFNIGVLLINRSREELREIGGVDFISELLVGSYPCRLKDGCEHCYRLCVQTCPRSAIREDRTIETSFCLSYLSQYMQPRPEVLGCTICQRVCPYNSGAF